MKSRDLRTVTVEHKTKRRPSAPAHASIWGNALGPFTHPSDRDSPVAPAPENQAPPVSATMAEGHGGIQARRILPDLRAAQVEAAEDVVSLRVKQRRAPRKRGETTLPDAETRRHDVEHPSTTPPLTYEAAPAVAIETSPDEAVTASKAQLSALFRPPVESRLDWRAATAPWTIAPHTRKRRQRSWTRKVHDLPRGERWKRRLPDVCR
jgi:hypothetical protein